MGGARQRKREIVETELCRDFLARGHRASYMIRARTGLPGR